MRRRWATARADDNQRGIVRDLRKCGARVISLVKEGHGCPDLLVYFRREFFLLEVKNPLTAYGRAGLNEVQRAFHLVWGDARVYVVRSSEEALTAIGARRSA
jgi:hypothetical protein